MKDKFISNKWSAKEAVSVAAMAQAAGAQGGEQFAKVDHLKNAARDLLRSCLKGCTVPELHYFKCRVKNKDGAVVVVDLPCLPPHEVLPLILEKSTPKQRRAWRNHPTRSADVQRFCTEFGAPVDNTYPLGLHGDGVPFKAKMADSIEQFSWSFCSDPTSPRTLFCVIPKSFCAGRDTYEDILGEFANSMKALATGDQCACLIELRGDWAYYNTVFGFPTWNSTRMCWKCAATQQGHCSYKDTGENSA